MEKKKEAFNKFKDKALHEKDSLFSILFINPISVRLAYFIKKKNLNISPNQITLTRLFLLSPLVIIFLFLAPILNLRILYLFIAILFYCILFTDWLDGQLARGTNKVSDKGSFLDLIADRVAIIIFFTFIFSVGLWLNNVFLLCGGVFLFVLKSFHMMVITQLYFVKERKKEVKSLNLVFSGRPVLNAMGVLKINLILSKLNNFLKIKRWSPGMGAPEQYFLIIMFPALLIAFNLEIFAVFLLYFYIIAYSLFFVLRIRNLLRDYV